GQLRYALQRLWNPRTEKGLLSLLRAGKKVELVADLLKESDKFFAAVEDACEGIVGGQPKPGDSSRAWTELRIRRHDLVPDTITLPMQRLREAVSELI